jgi:cytochrome c biogenesis protein
VNDFWVEYEENRIHQFYSNIAILDTFGKEIKEQTISVNNPLRYKNIDFYQSDWNLIGMRIKDTEKNKIYEIPFFPSNQKGKEIGKSWITWIKNEKSNQSTKELKQRTRTTTFLVDQFQNFGTLYDENGISLGQKNKGDSLESTNKIIFIDILPSTGLLIKYDPSIPVIYLGFGFLMITACLSYLPYNQIWIYNQKENCWIGSSTNRGKIQLEIDFENFIRSLEYEISKTNFIQKNNS